MTGPRDAAPVTAIVGVGMMGGTLLGGLVRAGWDADRLLIAERSESLAHDVSERTGVRVAGLAEVARTADTIVLVVKPQDALGVLDELATDLRAGTLVVSLCAGLRTERLEEHLPEGTPVVRVMPNTPASVGEAMSAISGGRHATDEHVAIAERLLGAVGQVVVVPEKYQDAVTAVSGSGPAYLFYVADAMIEAGVHLGLPRPVATQLATQTLVGSAKLLSESGTHPAVLRENVTSPAGTTAAALRVLDDRGVRAAFLAALEAARDRSVELS
ncbi:MAG TPA: pyrroline-5-carboxylate reductase [Propionibacteriaceae bacterium]|nr:pyrroline-5-carboxylate reductase [Propionibacteriaceae bacterium]